MPDLPAAVLVPLVVLWAAAWAALLVDVVRDPVLGARGRRAWVVAFVLLWVLAPILWAAVRFRRAARGARTPA
ncbi:MAG TPA: hypothetical protein VNT51_12930 [Miltoncostaeaceae bacterium]|nr:hypothetical protein [Miltoncostaeaceae bacterium]